MWIDVNNRVSVKLTANSVDTHFKNRPAYGVIMDNYSDSLSPALCEYHTKQRC